mmetsp:Transcript_1045/g.2285  ORF Transcript_1045/g.2285 Transcript_1045/m.2285 type:complete len:547 (-) Transcript_1045:109-1749(-)
MPRDLHEGPETIGRLARSSTNRARLVRAGCSIHSVYDIPSPDRKIQRTNSDSRSNASERDDSLSCLGDSFESQVADYTAWKKQKKRLAAAYKCLLTSSVFACFDGDEVERLANKISTEKFCAYVPAHTCAMQENQGDGVCLFLHRGAVSCFSKRNDPFNLAESDLGRKMFSKTAPALIYDLAFVSGCPWPFSAVTDCDSEIIVIMRSQMDDMLSDAKTEKKVSAHFRYLSERADVEFKEFSETFVDGDNQFLSIFHGVLEHPTMPPSFRPLIAPVAVRLRELSERFAAPLFQDIEDPLSSAATKQVRSDYLDVMRCYNMERRLERHGDVLSQARLQIDLSMATSRKARHDILVLRDHCRVANNWQTRQRFGDYEKKEETGASSLQRQFRDFKIQDVVDYFDKHGRRAPDLLRNEIALHARKLKERMDEAKHAIFDAGRVSKYVNRLKPPAKAPRATGSGRSLQAKSGSKSSLPGVTPKKKTPVELALLHDMKKTSGRERTIAKVTGRSKSVEPLSDAGHREEFLYSHDYGKELLETSLTDSEDDSA